MTKPVYVRREGGETVWHLANPQWVDGDDVTFCSVMYGNVETTETPDRVCKACLKVARRSLRGLTKELIYLKEALNA